MTNSLLLALSGGDGRMGRVLQALVREDGRLQLAHCVNASSEWANAPKLDVVIDFSTPAGFDAALAHCREHRVAFVSGTTGLDATRRTTLSEAARDIPLLHAANFSLGVAVLTRALRDAAAALPDWDLEILEAHHARKADAPSGTALALGHAAAAARGQDFESVAVLSREGQVGPRRTGTIGFAALRAGDIVGEHSAVLATAGERIELSHRATDRVIFARGALAAAAWLAAKPPGAYALEGMLGNGVRDNS
jgi:4-hydroxy-tetrahydrodipicolinate reductase